jgi:hypothetical protein
MTGKNYVRTAGEDVTIETATVRWYVLYCVCTMRRDGVEEASKIRRA